MQKPLNTANSWVHIAATLQSTRFHSTADGVVARLGALSLLWVKIEWLSWFIEAELTQIRGGTLGMLGCRVIAFLHCFHQYFVTKTVLPRNVTHNVLQGQSFC
jgi:hypothetical protein